MKARITLLLLVCFTFGVTGRILFEDAPADARGARCCSHREKQQSPCGAGHSRSDPCPAYCILCANCLVTNLTAPDAFWVRLTSSRHPAESDWLAGRLTYPPPLPPPRLPGC